MFIIWLCGMNKKYIITEFNNMLCGFLMEDGKAKEIRCYDEESILGNIYVGRVSNIVKNINSAFVDIKKGLSCYYPLEDYTGKKLKIGDLLTVQVNKEPIKTKQPSVTTKLSMTGEYVVVHQDDAIGVSTKIKDNSKREGLKTIFEKAINDFKAKQKCKDVSFGGIIRTKAEEVSDDIIYNETIKILCNLDGVLYKSQYATAYSCMYEKMPSYLQDIDSMAGNVICENESDIQKDLIDNIEVITDMEYIIEKCQEYNIVTPKLYDDAMVSMRALYNLDTVVEKALNKKVYLKSGAYLIIEHTEAMTVIDVNSGKAIKGNNKEEKVFAINLEAAKEIARQLRLRNISGMIIVDFISMSNSYKEEQLLKSLREYVQEDSVLTTVVDITKLGLVEMTRKRIRRPLYEVM